MIQFTPAEIRSTIEVSGKNRHFYNKMGEKLENWVTGFGYISDTKKNKEAGHFQQLINSMPQEVKGQLVSQAAPNCQISGIKTCLGRWRNTQTIVEIAITADGEGEPKFVPNPSVLAEETVNNTTSKVP